MVVQDNPLDSQVLANSIDAYLEAFLESGYFMGAVLVARAGDVLLSNGYGMANLEHKAPNTSQTKFRLGSITKQFTAAAILQLQEQGLLQVNAPISTYLPDYPNGEQITIHHLLNHTAGIPNYTSFPDFPQKTRTVMSLDELIAWFSDRPLEFTAGERHRYSNSGYVVLTKIIEVVSGQSYTDYLQHHIFEPLDMTSSGYDRSATILPHRASGYIFAGADYPNEDYLNAAFLDMSIPSGAGALYSTVEDLYKWEQALYTDAILSQHSRTAMFAPTIVVDPEETQKTYYGYGWLIDTHEGRDRLFHDGGINGFSAILSRYPKEQITIIVLSNLETAPFDRIANDIAAILFGEPYELPKQQQAIEVDSAIYEAYVGDYELVPGISLRITTQSGRIFAQLPGQQRYEIFPESPTKFFWKIMDAQITFVVDRNGEVMSAIWHRGGRDTTAPRRTLFPVVG